MLDSDINNADAQLHVEFYLSDLKGWEGKPFVRIQAPGDKTNIVERPVLEEHKARFPRQWLYFQMKQNETDTAVIGTPLETWQAESTDFSKAQMEELKILRFQTIEQVALASDSQLQRIGMGGPGLRERARMFLQSRNKTEAARELEDTKKQLAELQSQMAELMDKPRRGRPPKEDSA